MALANGEGLCDRQCDIDTYLEATNEMALMEQIADLGTDGLSEDHAMRAKALRMVLGFQEDTIDEAKLSAAVQPCEGYNEAGIAMQGLLTGIRFHCPVVVRQFRSTFE